MLPTIGGFLTYLRALSPKQRIGMAFGSFGWGGQGVDQVDAMLKECGFAMLEPVKVKYIPSAATLQEITSKVEKAVG